MILAIGVLTWLACFSFCFWVMVQSTVRDGFDVKVNDCVLFALLSSMGPCSVIAAVVIGLTENIFFKKRNLFQKVVFPAKKGV